MAFVANALPNLFVGKRLSIAPRAPVARSQVRPFATWKEVGKDAELPEGERLITEVNGKSIIVTKQQGQLYAVSSVCPHLGLPMKKGAIDSSKPSITCSFHKSEFNLKDGSVLCWSESVMGIPGTQVIGNLLGNIKKSTPLPTFPVKVDSGAILVDA
eukprot:CAMPEP_0184656500 /NCGR_PEP_ID=MMETSP0308-20130426/16551_1 /TAXON_ID=38269 /ORGANISM="Gloeochaete witrockiana, Strain SAG 46.84" /LENGTH=156 /DNA_ID=CAMNT_0027093659 /DNA_START=58 /DNA_END=528 /DNA_ORIENTATION=-